MPAKKSANVVDEGAAIDGLTVIYRDPKDLIPNPTNARTHTAETVNELAGVIQMFGWTNPILIDDVDMIYAGHRRQKAALMLKLKSVPCFDISHLTPDQRKAMMLADNRIALNAGWDLEMLGSDLRDLANKGMDLKALGFNQDELDAALAGIEDPAPPDDFNEVDDETIETNHECPKCGYKWSSTLPPA